MVNPVGSCENINWQKKWRLIKPSLFLTEEQKALIIGSLLGDGTMRLGKGATNVNFKVEHGLKQEQYVRWKYQILRSFVFTEPKLSYRYTVEGERYAKSWWFRTIRHPLLTTIYWRFYTSEGYRTGMKIIPADIGQDLTPLALAVWIMDDGSYSRARIDISTYCFSLSEIGFLQQLVEKIFDIKLQYYRDRDKGYRMYTNLQETEKLIAIIKPYVIPSMQYKIGFR